jgi:putative nucleotidyltransferase with HDIG domain
MSTANKTIGSAYAGKELKVTNNIQPFDEEDLNTGKLLNALNSIHELPTLPSVVMQVSSMLQDIETSAKALAEVIECDQAIVPKLLKLVNSAFFGFSSKVSNVAHALMLLGFNTVQNAIISIAIIKTLDLKKKIPGFDLADFWRHTIAVAVTARHLDKALGGHFKEDAFTAGLIHDIGKIIMAQYFQERFIATYHDMQSQNTTFSKAEQSYFPVSHAAMGARIAKKWGLPPILCNVIKRHHQPKTGGEKENLVLIVHTADALVNTHMNGDTASMDWPICTAARQLLTQQIESVSEWCVDLESEINSACQILVKE